MDSQLFNLLESYHRLADCGLPTEAFADGLWDLNNRFKINERPAPSADVQCVFMPKGLLVFIQLYQSFADVADLRLFVGPFAAVSRGLHIKVPRSPVLTFSIDNDFVNMPLRTLAAECSEYFVQHQDGDQSKVDTSGSQ